MTDRFCGAIWIGGKFPKSLVPELVEALYNDEASHDYGEPPLEEDCDDLSPYIDANGLLCLKSDRAENGEFPQTETFLLGNGISYNRWSEHYAEYDAENVYYRTGMKEPIWTYADSDGDEVVRGETVREAIAQMKAGFPDSIDLEGFEKALQLLEDACPALPEPLEKFEIVE